MSFFLLSFCSLLIVTSNFAILWVTNAVPWLYTTISSLFTVSFWSISLTSIASPISMVPDMLPVDTSNAEYPSIAVYVFPLMLICIWLYAIIRAIPNITNNIISNTHLNIFFTTLIFSSHSILLFFCFSSFFSCCFWFWSCSFFSCTCWLR